MNSRLCPYIRRDQKPCNTKIKGDSQFCYKHKNARFIKGSNLTLPESNQEEQRVKAMKSSVISKIIDDTLLNQFDQEEEHSIDEIKEVVQQEPKQKKKDYNNMSEDDLANLLEEYISLKDKKAIDVLKALKSKNIISNDEYKNLFSSLM